MQWEYPMPSELNNMYVIAKMSILGAIGHLFCDALNKALIFFSMNNL